MSNKTQSSSSEASRVLSLSISQSTYSTAIAKIYGKARVPTNLLYYNDFASHAQSSSSGSSGKGGGSSSSSTTSYTYSATFMLALGSGVVSSVSTVWIDSTAYSLSATGFELHTGEVGQSAWSYLTGAYPADAYTYSNCAYIACANYDLGTSSSSPQFGVECVGELSTTSDGDAVAADVLVDMWTDTIDGLAQSESDIEGLDDYRLWCEENDFYISPVLDTQQESRTYFQQILDATMSVAVPSQGKIRIVPLGDQAVGDWEPDTTAVCEITNDDLLNDEEPKLTIKQPSELTNRVIVEFKNRDNDYNSDSVPASDAANISDYGVVSETKSLPCIKRKSMAATIADALLSRGLYVRRELEIKVDQRFCYLEPQDKFIFTHARLGMSAHPFVVLEIEEDEDGDLSIKAEEFPFAVSTPVVPSTESSGGYTPNYNVSSGNANTPVIFEPPVSLAGSAQIWLLTSGGDNWGGAHVYLSLDNATYSQIGTVTTDSRHGYITSAYPVGADPDTTNALPVDISVSDGQITGVSATVRDLYESLCFVGTAASGELVSYLGATLTGVGKYNLSSCRRGCYGSKIVAHSAGEQFARIDGTQFAYTYNTDLIGKTVYIKLRSYNTFGNALQDLADITPVAYVVKGAPLGAVANLVLESPFSGLTFAAKWDAYAGANSYGLSLYSGGSLCWSITTTETRFSATIAQLVAKGIGRTVELRVVAVSENGQSTDAAVLIATKAQCAAPTVSLQNTSGSMVVTASASTDPAYKATRICISQNSGFDPANTTPYYDGPQTAYPSGSITTGAWYVRVCQYDQFGADSLNWTTEQSLTVSTTATGVPTVTNASSITGTAGGNPPGGSAYWAVFDSATGKLWRWNAATGTYICTTSGSDIVANSIAADKMAVSSLSAVSAALGLITSGTIEMTSGAWNYIRTSGKWLSDTVNGWIFAANPATGDYFQDFRAASGSAVFLERKSGGPNVGYSYLLKVVDASGTTRLLIDPANATYTFNGSITAASGTFAGTLSGVSGTFGTITAGILENAAATTIINLNGSGSDAFLTVGGTVRVKHSGATTWKNLFASLTFRPRSGGVTAASTYDYISSNGYPVAYEDVSVKSVDDDGTINYSYVYHNPLEIFADTGITMDSIEDAYGAAIVARITNCVVYWFGETVPSTEICLAQCEPFYQVPVASGQTWTNARLFLKVKIGLTETSAWATKTKDGAARLAEITVQLYRLS